MRIRQISLIVASLAVALLALATALTVLAGSTTDSPAVPGSTYSHTLEHIYDRLDTGAATAAITFTEPITGPEGTMHTLDEIYDLVGERAPVPKTGQTETVPLNPAPAGSDGDLKKGVAWPTPRFITSTTGIVTDTLTGLIWLENANCATFFFGDSTGQNNRSWANALTAANSLANDYCGLTDSSTAGQWRLPNVNELLSLIHWGVYNPAVPNTAGTGQWTSDTPFTNVQSDYYWSSTTYEHYTDSAWVVNLGNGGVSYDVKTYDFYVWPVRGGQ